MFISQTSGNDADTNRMDYALPKRHFGTQTAARGDAGTALERESLALAARHCTIEVRYSYRRSRLHKDRAIAPPPRK
jgi:hypothetical protein